MTKKTKVLVVEDEIPILDLYDKKFTTRGFEVIRAEDGESGAEKALSEKPDIIILDLMLPMMNGFEVLKRIKKDKATKDTPVIILSNYGEMPNVTEGMLGGAAEYLIKVEHTPEEVVEITEDVLAGKGSIVGEAFKEAS